MAESVVKLRLESGEYDSKIKRAAQNILSFGENCQKAGQSVAKADKDTLDYVQAIGKMETVSKTAKGKINEMTSAFTELSVQYKQLTDEEKKSPYGQALSQSLDQLKGRINESKAQLSEINSELGNTSNKGNETGVIMQQLAGKFTLTLDAVKLFNIGMKAADVALDVAKDAFFASEATVDEWGRTMDANRSLYEGFLNAINNSDISGFLSNINQIISAARAAYDELDRLGTMRTIQAPQISAQQAENDRLRLMIQTGRWISAPGKDSLGMKDGQILTAPQINELKRMLNNGVQTLVTLTKNEVQQTGKAINAFYNRQSRELNMSEAEFRKGTSSMAEFDKRMAGYDAYKKWDADAKARFAQQGGRGFVDFDKRNPYAAYRRWGNFRVDGDRYNELVQLIQQRDQQTSSMFNMQGQAYRTMNRAEGVTLRGIMGDGGGGGSHGGRVGGTVTPTYVPVEGSIDAQNAKVQALQKAWRAAADDDSRQKIKSQLDEANKVLDTMQGKVTNDAPVGSMKYYSNWLKELQDAQQLVTNNNDWERYAGQIDFVTKKMRELRGEAEKQPEMATGLSGMTSTAIGAWIQDQQQSLGNMEIGSKGYNKTYGNIVDATTLQNLLTTTAQQGIDLAAMGIDMEPFWDRILDGQNIPDKDWVKLQDIINQQLAALNVAPIKIDVNTGEITQQAKTLSKDWMAAASAIQSVGSAMQSIEDPAMKVIGTIAQAIASIALGAGQAIEAKSRETGNKWEWIAFAASATATMISSIAAVKSNTKGFEQGGIIPGNRWSGDNLSTADYGINSGELVLTRAQQGNLASQLQGNNSSMEMQPYLDVEKIWLGLRHYTNRTGKGEIVTTR